MSDSVPNVRSADEATKWIAILHRRTVQDAERMNIIEVRLDQLETPWWRWRRRRSNRGYLAWLRGQQS